MLGKATATISEMASMPIPSLRLTTGWPKLLLVVETPFVSQTIIQKYNENFISFHLSIYVYVPVNQTYLGVWVHVEGTNTPNFDSNGYTTSPDRTGTLAKDLKSFLDAAKAKNILVVFVLWNGALQRTQNVINLFWDKSKLQSYIDKALKVIQNLNEVGMKHLFAYAYIAHGNSSESSSSISRLGNH